MSAVSLTTALEGAAGALPAGVDEIDPSGHGVVDAAVETFQLRWPG